MPVCLIKFVHLVRHQTLIKNSVVKYFKATLILMFITFIELAMGLSIIKGSNPIGMAHGIAMLMHCLFSVPAAL